jgi:hypothetical protein
MRRRFREANGMLRQADFEDWCDWALAQADDLDPVKNLESFLKSGQMNLGNIRASNGGGAESPWCAFTERCRTL